MILEKSAGSRLLAQAIDSTAILENSHLTHGEAKIFLKYYINSISCASVRAQLIFLAFQGPETCRSPEYITTPPKE